jgi:flagellar motor switch protein FliG
VHRFRRWHGQRRHLIGSFESTERLLQKSLPRDRVSQIMEEIRGPAGRTMWDKLGNVNEAVLANYLKNEYPQTVAVVLSKVKPEHAANVLTLLPEAFAMEVVMRMLRMEACRRTCWTASSERCAPSSCPTWRAPPGATRTR